MMKLKLVCWVVMMGGGAVFFVHEFRPTPVYSVAAAEAKQREYNAHRWQFQCGQWMVHAHFNGEGRLYYDAPGCPLDPTVRAHLVEHNALMDQATTMEEINREQAQLVWVSLQDGYNQRTQQQTKGMDSAIRDMYRGIR